MTVGSCGECGAEAQAGAKFCAECGSALAVSCPTCAAPVTPGQRFCAECGTPLAGAAPATPTAPTASAHPERRLVTVLFADLVSFTGLSEHRDPEAVRDMLELYFERCRTIIGRYGGIVEKFIGDAVMAVWGTPVAREDDAERAVRAGLELVAAVAALGEEIAMPELSVRAGLLTGETAVNVGAEHEGMVIGDAVNTASRIQSLAEPGAVYVEDRTRRATERAIAYEEAGTHEVKGREQPVRVFRALRVTAGVGGAGRGSGLEAPFVGRDRELRAITLAGERVIERRRAEMITILGDAGMGKSRLAWEFEKKVDGIADEVFWHRGRCLSYGEGVSFWALAEIVRMRADIAESEGLAAARAKLRATVEEFVTDERERRLVLPRLEHLLGLGEAGGDPGDLFSGWRLFFERLAAVDPVVMVFEDLQWADTGLLAFIDHLIEWASESPIFVLALARPEVCDRRPAWADSAHRLGPLDDAAMHDLLGGLIPGLPESAVDRIAARAEGVPLYAVETVRMLLDRGVLAQRDDVYVVTGDVDDIQVPETLHALVASRLDGLSAGERRVVQDASVLGATFTAASVAALGELAVTEATALLDGLVAKQIFQVERDPRSPERGQYGFVQALLKAVAYGTLGRRDRKARHLKVAEYLEGAWRDGAEDYAEVLATHYEEALRAEPDAPDAPSLRTRAADTLTEAGRRAMSFGLGGEARAWFLRAAEMADGPKRRAELTELAGRGALLAAEPDVLELFERAAVLYEEVSEPRRAIVARGHASAQLMLDGRSGEGVVLLRGLLEALGTEELDADVAFIAGELARHEMIVGAVHEGLAHVEAALVYAERTRDLDLLANALVTRGTLCDRVDRGEEGMALLRHGLALALERDLPGAATRAYNNLSELLLRVGRFPELLELAEPGVRLAELRGDRQMLWSIENIRARGLIRLGRWDEALAVADRIEGLARLSVLADLVPALIARGDEALARRVLAEAETAPMDEPGIAVDVAAAQAAVAIADGEPERGLDLVRDTIDAMVEVALPPNAFHVLLDAALAAGRPEEGEAAIAKLAGAGNLFASADLSGRIAAFRGRAALGAGDRPRAEAELERAVDWLREAGVAFDLARALRDLGELRADAALSAEAQRLFAEVGATAYLGAVAA